MIRFHVGVGSLDPSRLGCADYQSLELEGKEPNVDVIPTHCLLKFQQIAFCGKGTGGDGRLPGEMAGRDDWMPVGISRGPFALEKSRRAAIAPGAGPAGAVTLFLACAAEKTLDF
jgi:hypothetical protein